MVSDVHSPVDAPVDLAGLETGRLLTPGEVAQLFRVDLTTVIRWAAAGRLGSIRTPGGHRRYRESEVHSLLEMRTTEATNPVTGD